MRAWYRIFPDSDREATLAMLSTYTIRVSHLNSLHLPDMVLGQQLNNRRDMKAWQMSYIFQNQRYLRRCAAAQMGMHVPGPLTRTCDAAIASPSASCKWLGLSFQEP